MCQTYDSDLFCSLHFHSGENGVIEGGFGQSGKFKVRIPSELCCDSRVNSFHICTSCATTA